MDGPGQSEEGTVFDQLYVYLSISLGHEMKENLFWLTAGAVVLGFYFDLFNDAPHNEYHR